MSVDFSASDAAADFMNALTSGGDALTSLAAKCDALELAATDDQDVNIAQQARRFATVAGPRGLQRAKDTGDANEMILVQRGIAGVTSDVTDALVDDVVERFLVLDMTTLLVGPFGIVAAAAPPEAFDQLREAVATVPTPPAPQELPLPAFIAGGALAGGGFAFVTSGNWRAAIAGAVVGAAGGAAIKIGLQKIADRFNLFGSTS